jgi:Tol biopolymer transport system component
MRALVFALIVLLAFACNGGEEGPRTATLAPPNTIVATFFDFNREIYTVAPDGHRLTRVTNTPGHVEWEPVWSPDGRLAIVRWPFFVWDQDELMVMSADGTEPVRVAGGMDISRPAWSADGSRIAFVEGAMDLGPGPDVFTSCTPADSSWIQAPPRLFVAEVASRTAVPLVDLVSPDGCVLLPQPQWSPDGTKIALASRGVYVVDVASGRLTEIVPPTDAIAAAWSPDGQRLAVAAAPSLSNPSARILVVGADGQGLTEIARFDGPADSLAWSPQGGLIAFIAGTDGFSGEARLFVVNPDGSGLRSLVQGVQYEFAWSPDGRRLAVSLVDPSFSPFSGVASNIYTVDVNDGSTTRLTDAPASEYGPAWSPDGSAIAFVSGRDAQSGILAVHSDGALTPMVSTFDREPPQAFLRPDGRLIVPADVFVEVAHRGRYPLFGGTLSPDGRRLATSVPTGDMVSEGCSGDVRDIYAWNVDGSQVTNLTNTPDINETELVWSLDSLLLALTSGAPPQCHLDPTRLEVMKADGSERRLLADLGPFGRVGLPEWISEGSALLFSVTYPGHGALPGLPASEDKAEIYTVNIDGSGLRRLLESPGARIRWLLSPDRTRLAVAEAGTAGGWRVLLASADGTGLQEVARGQGQFPLDGQLPLSWSPDSTRLAFVGCEGDPCRPVAFVINGDGSGLRGIARGQGEVSQFQWWPSSWSPDGTRLVFADCQGDPCQWALFIVNAEGSDLHKLVDPFVPYDAPTWSPDGSQLALVTHPDPCGPGEGVPPGYLEVVDVDSGASQRLTERCVVRGVLGWPP